MDDKESLSHSRWDCKYHIVFIPKCRRRMMCQHFSGHTVRQFYAVIHNQRVTHNHCWNVDDAGYKKPRYIQILTV